MIFQLREECSIIPILNMIVARNDLFDINSEKAKYYLEQGIKSDSSIIIVDEKDKKINGFVFASIEEFNGEDVCFIFACVVSPDMKQTVHDFIAKLRKWSKEKGLKKMLLSTKTHPEGFSKKYGFKYESTLMSLAVEK